MANSLTPRLSRRTVLRGLGVSMALPWLEATSAVAGSLPAAAVPPTRMAFIFVPNGVHLPAWTPQTEGYGFELPRILKSLSPVKNNLTVLSGLTHDKGRANGDGPGDHARSASVFLTGAQPRKTEGENIRSGISVDQVAAQAIGHYSRFSSLELGVDEGRNTGNCDSGYSCAYSHNISWSSETTPLGKEVNPRLVFERLFAGGAKSQVESGAKQRQALNKSILDFVSEDAKRLQPKLSRNDNLKLDEYLSGVREIERRVGLGVPSAKIDASVDYPVPAGIPKDYREHLRLMCDMMVLAFQTESTRIATMMFARAGDNKNYPSVGVREGHHELSHHRDDPDKLEKITRINEFHVQQLSYMLQKMASIEEGERSLLDNSMIVYGSGLSDGNRHNNENLPILLAGSGGGSIAAGRHVRYDTETPLCNLFMSMLQRMDVHVPFVGDSTGCLPGLSG
ncbi:MAG: DUF1552 domain-containing protein [Planctomycetales bacterium]|nr:DUF1552 domain-containing protein [Planctomycetales bacterium]